MTKKLAIVGGGPAALMVYKRLVGLNTKLSIDIFEASETLGSGMPYSPSGAGAEHVTNVSSDELPELLVPLADWLRALPQTTLEQFAIRREEFHEKKILPRLLFGQYLTAQFNQAIDLSAQKNIETQVHYKTVVTDIGESEASSKASAKVTVVTAEGASDFDCVIICTGHHWPHEREGKVPGYFDSPYPPAKLAKHFNHKITVRGSSLTAVDAIRTTARHNGAFKWIGARLTFKLNDDSPQFRIAMHSRHGLLPCIRVHLEEPHAGGKSLISPEGIEENIRKNDGFLELDYLFEQGFKLPLKESDPAFYERIKSMNIEEFVDAMMKSREAIDPFTLFKKEYVEAKKSIEQERPVYWKEMLSALSFAMNYPAKYLSAEDMLRLRKHLMPLISVVIAFMPQSSCEELMALHDAGILELISDGDGGEAEITDDNRIIYCYEDDDGNEQKVECQTFIDCIGQKPLALERFPFQGLIKGGTVSHARLKFKSSKRAKELTADGEKNIEELNGEYYLRVSGANISDNFQVVDAQGKASERVYLMAVPYMSGFNPDYSGLDFCERASELIVSHISQVQ